MIGHRSEGRNEHGYVAILAALMMATFAFGCAAVGVDVARLYVEVQRAQRAAHAGALAGVTYLPDFGQATDNAIETSMQNGYPNSGTSTVATAVGTQPSQLKVTVCSKIRTYFGAAFGVGTANVCRYAVADFTQPQPMGSPCNVFGNEPAGSDANSAGGGPAASQLKVPSPATCDRIPKFWMSVAGPNVPKENGDQYDTRYCGSSDSSGCNGTTNTDFHPEGEFLIVRVAPAAVNKSLTVQLYDPNYIPNYDRCDYNPSGPTPTARSWTNPWVTYNDAVNRYDVTNGTDSPTEYCTGDNPSGAAPTITSFGLRQPSDTLDPTRAVPQPGCTRQYPGVNTSDITNQSLSTDTTITKSFHLWRSLCTFTPPAVGDYYLQIRTNVAMGGAVNQDDGSYSPSTNATASSKVFTQTGDDPSVVGQGANRFAVRAISAATTAGAVSVAAYGRMPIYANADSATSTFNLIQVLPSARGKAMLFTFFDLGDADSSGTVTVLPPTDSNLPASLNGCSASGYKTYAALSGCSLGGLSSNAGWNGKAETIAVPIPTSYTCTSTSSGGCWFRVKVSFPGGKVTDTTTWTANVTGAPVRLVE